MKFTDGFWMTKPGVTVFGNAEIRHITCTDEKFTAFVSHFPVTHRGQTLGGPLLTLEITSPRQDIIGINMYHYKNTESKAPAFELNYDPQK